MMLGKDNGSKYGWYIILVFVKFMILVRNIILLVGNSNSNKIFEIYVDLSVAAEFFIVWKWQSHKLDGMIFHCDANFSESQSLDF